jgi:cyclohexadienyl dehydratase
LTLARFDAHLPGGRALPQRLTAPQHRVALAACVIVLCALACAARAPLDGLLRVGTSGDYAPFSVDAGGRLEGFDVAVLRAFAAERGLAVEWVRFRWPELVDDLAAGRFDVAIGGVTVRPERSVAGRFTLPLAESGALALVQSDARFATLSDLDRPGVRVAVNRGGHLERVARAQLPRAALAALAPNAAVLEALVAGRADAAVSDTLEGSRWQREAGGLRAIGPFTRDRKAWLVRAGRVDLAEELDAWLLARAVDGSLGRWRAEHLGAAGPETAAAGAALLAAFDERLALMPLVAAAKRSAGRPLEDAGREARVLEAAHAAAAEAAARSGRPAPPEAVVQALWRAQMEAAKAAQRAAAPSVAGEAPAPDLESELRPALGRIDARTARLLVALEAPLDCEPTRAAARAALRAPGVDDAHVLALADALVAASGGACP